MAGPAASEDPITGLFDLTDRVAEAGPKIRRLLLATAAVIAVFLAILVYLLFEALRGSLLLVVLALAGVALGGVALTLLSESERFYAGFAERHRRLRLLQFAEPSPRIPKGPTPMRRLARHLARSNPRVAELLAAHPEALRIRTRRTADDDEVEFALSIVAPAGRARRWLGLGDPGFVILAQVGPEAPTPEDLDRFGRTAVGVARKLGGRLRRAILLRLRSGPMDDAVYERAVRHPVEVPGGPAVPIEVITELDDGTYDLVPHVIGVP